MSLHRNFHWTRKSAMHTQFSWPISPRSPHITFNRMLMLPARQPSPFGCCSFCHPAKSFPIYRFRKLDSHQRLRFQRRKSFSVAVLLAGAGAQVAHISERIDSLSPSVYHLSDFCWVVGWPKVKKSEGEGGQRCGIVELFNESAKEHPVFWKDHRMPKCWLHVSVIVVWWLFREGVGPFGSLGLCCWPQSGAQPTRAGTVDYNGINFCWLNKSSSGCGPTKS